MHFQNLGGAELLLFVLVGTTVNISYVAQGDLIHRTNIYRPCNPHMWCAFCLIRTKFTVKERLFCAIAYLPKATVQAAIGTLPLEAVFTVGTKFGYSSNGDFDYSASWCIRY